MRRNSWKNPFICNNAICRSIPGNCGKSLEAGHAWHVANRWSSLNMCHGVPCRNTILFITPLPPLPYTVMSRDFFTGFWLHFRLFMGKFKIFTELWPYKARWANCHRRLFPMLCLDFRRLYQQGIPSRWDDDYHQSWRLGPMNPFSYWPIYFGRVHGPWALAVLIFNYSIISAPCTGHVALNLINWIRPRTF